MIAKKLESSVAPTINPSIYSNQDILNGRDGLFVAKVVTDWKLFGKIVEIQSRDATPSRKKRGYTLSDFKIPVDYSFSFMSFM